MRVTTILTAIVAGLSSPAVSMAAEVTITGPVLSVYEDGFRIADESGRALRVDAWSVCGDETRSHLKRGDNVKVEGDREWRLIDAHKISRDDGSSACPAENAPKN